MPANSSTTRRGRGRPTSRGRGRRDRAGAAPYAASGTRGSGVVNSEPVRRAVRFLEPERDNSPVEVTGGWGSVTFAGYDNDSSDDSGELSESSSSSDDVVEVPPPVSGPSPYEIALQRQRDAERDAEANFQEDVRNFGRAIAEFFHPERQQLPALPEVPLPLGCDMPVPAFVAHGTWYGNGPPSNSSDALHTLDLSIPLPSPTDTGFFLPMNFNAPSTAAAELPELHITDVIDFTSIPNFVPSPEMRPSSFGADDTAGAVLLGADAPPTVVAQLQPEFYENDIMGYHSFVPELNITPDILADLNRGCASMSSIFDSDPGFQTHKAAVQAASDHRAFKSLPMRRHKNLPGGSHRHAPKYDAVDSGYDSGVDADGEYDDGNYEYAETSSSSSSPSSHNPVFTFGNTNNKRGAKFIAPAVASGSQKGKRKATDDGDFDAHVKPPARKRQAKQLLPFIEGIHAPPVEVFVAENRPQCPVSSTCAPFGSNVRLESSMTRHLRSHHAHAIRPITLKSDNPIPDSVPGRKEAAKRLLEALEATHTASDRITIPSECYAVVPQTTQRKIRVERDPYETNVVRCPVQTCAELFVQPSGPEIDRIKNIGRHLAHCHLVQVRYDCPYCYDTISYRNDPARRHIANACPALPLQVRLKAAEHQRLNPGPKPRKS